MRGPVEVARSFGRHLLRGKKTNKKELSPLTRHPNLNKLEKYTSLQEACRHATFPFPFVYFVHGKCNTQDPLQFCFSPFFRFLAQHERSPRASPLIALPHTPRRTIKAPRGCPALHANLAVLPPTQLLRMCLNSTSTLIINKETMLQPSAFWWINAAT